MHLPPYKKWSPKDHFSTSENHVVSWCRILNYLSETIQRVDEEYRPDGHEDSFEPHLPTYKKLLLASSYVYNTLKIASKYAGNVYYLDVLSASGLSPVQGEDYAAPGSCFALPLACQDWDEVPTPPDQEFDKVWAFDYSKENLKAIECRREGIVEEMELSLPPFTTVPGDANTSISGVLDEIQQETVRCHQRNEKPPLTYAFIDNEALDIKMSTIQEIQQKVRADLLIHVPTRAIWREIQRSRTEGDDGTAVTEFFGDDVWREIEDSSSIPQVYMEQVERITDGTFQELEPVEISSETSDFALLVCVRETSGIRERDSGGWIEKIKPLARGCNQIDKDRLEEALAQGIGNQSDLGQFS